MDIGFVGSTNSDNVYINTATFRLPSGELVVVDRDTTEFSVSEDGLLEMSWINCYIWDGERANYTLPSDFFDDTELVSIEVEDDAPAGYEVNIGYVIQDIHSDKDNHKKPFPVEMNGHIGYGFSINDLTGMDWLHILKVFEPLHLEAYKKYAIEHFGRDDTSTLAKNIIEYLSSDYYLCGYICDIIHANENVVPLLQTYEDYLVFDCVDFIDDKFDFERKRIRYIRSAEDFQEMIFKYVPDISHIRFGHICGKISTEKLFIIGD